MALVYVFAWGGCHGADDKQAVFEGMDTALKEVVKEVCLT